MTANLKLKRLLEHCVKNDFIYPKECLMDYNSTAFTSFNFGPLGTILRQNIIKQWWKSVCVSQDNVFPVENTLIDTLTMKKKRKNSQQKQISLDTLQHYSSVYNMVQGQLPFGIATVKTDFGTDVTQKETNKVLYNSPQYASMLLYYFVHPRNEKISFDFWKRHRIQWWKSFADNPSNFTMGQVRKEEDYTQLDILYSFPWGDDTIETLRNYNEGFQPGAKMTKTVKKKRSRKLAGVEEDPNATIATIPHMFETNAVLERAVLAYLLDACNDTNGKRISKRRKNDETLLLNLHRKLAPYTVALSTPERPNQHIQEVTRQLVQELRKAEISVLSTHDPRPIEEQYERYSGMGIPLCLTLHEGTLDNGLLYMRHRNTKIKEEIHVTKVCEYLLKFLAAD
ncbi:unnamed protein product [Owenia fusiformis]|uniref:Uncharacterized protein n=1 Tax=Owenia fusiformis TaxID=6347 RepID=A0A8J1U6A5_OWEFU|nr:unnamed protein product [Owenia fusiformis]